MDQETAHYIVKYYSRLFSVTEALAYKHALGQFKLGHSTRDNTGMELHLKKAGFLSEDQTVLDLLKDGYDAFERQVAERLLAEHPDTVLLNLCPSCARLARTPEARQCRHCGARWA